MIWGFPSLLGSLFSGLKTLKHRPVENASHFCKLAGKFAHPAGSKLHPLTRLSLWAT